MRKSESLYRRRVREVAKELESQGYRVIVEPSESELPRFLAGHRPDLLAFGDEDNVVVEIKGGTSREEMSDIVPLSALVSDQDGWRFHLIMAKPRGRLVPTDSEEFSAHVLERFLNDASRLAQHDNREASLLLSFVALEGAMRLWMQWLYPKKTRVRSVSELAKELTFAGHLSDRDFELIVGAQNKRNAIVHAFTPESLEPGDISKLEDLARRILAHVRS